MMNVTYNRRTTLEGGS